MTTATKTIWECPACGWGAVCEGDERPERCPKCGSFSIERAHKDRSVEFAQHAERILAGDDRPPRRQPQPATTEEPDMSAKKGTRTCNVPDCKVTKIIGRGLCGKHYYRLTGADAANRAETEKYADPPARGGPAPAGPARGPKAAKPAKPSPHAKVVPARQLLEALGLGGMPYRGGLLVSAGGETGGLAWLADDGRVHRVSVEIGNAVV